MLYLAPLQGFTDFIYRKAYSEVFEGIDSFFIPYISIKNGQILKKHYKEILPENNPQTNAIPQVLPKDSEELLHMLLLLSDYGYKEINLNLGCPYPMVTKRGKGAGLLPFPEKIEQMCSAFFEKTDVKLSVKLRAGLNSEKEIEQIIPVLNQFPLSEIIVHARIAKQLYKGETHDSAFDFVRENAKHNVIFNGDIFSVEDYHHRKNQFLTINDWMLGRGILMNPFLPAEIKGKLYTKDEKHSILMEFHRNIYESYSEKMDNPGNVLNKMKQFWEYFSFNFPNRKCYNKIKKSNSIQKYSAETQKIFNDFGL